MDPLQLLTSGPAWLATTDVDGTPRLAQIVATRGPERLAFETSLPRGRQAVLRRELELTSPLEGRAFLWSAEARGLLDERGLRISSIQAGPTPLADRTLLEQLWLRGDLRDAEAIQQLVDANPEARPTFLQGPPGFTMCCALTHAEREAAVEMLAPLYWNADLPRERVARAVHGATCNVGARDAKGKLVAHARALSDDAKYAWIYDVVVHESLRGKGLGQALVTLLLDHPRVRHARQVLLATRDAQTLYARYGFIDRRDAPKRTYTSTEMVLRRVD